MDRYRKLDILVLENVFNEKVLEINEPAGMRIDMKSRMENSEANRPVYLGDYVYGYELKKFSTDTSYFFEIIDKIKEKGFRVEIGELFNGTWSVSLWRNDYEKDREINNVKTASAAITLALLSAYGYCLDSIQDIEFNIK